MDVDISYKYFSKVFWHIESAAKKSYRFFMLYGGAGSSKSYSFHQHIILRSFSDKYDTLIIRKTGASLRNSVYKGVKERINSFKLSHFFDFRYSNENRVIVNNTNGIQLVFAGLDDPEKIKSIENFQRVYIEEANQLTFKDFLELNRRVRGKQNIQIWFLFNPVNIHHWIKRHFFDNPKVIPKTKFIKVTYKDNKFLTISDIQELEDLQYIDANDYNVYALGNWGIPSEGLIWKEVDKFENIKVRENKIYWSKYSELPDYDFFEIFALDFGGGSKLTDAPDGSSKTVFEKMYINKSSKSVYHKLIIYKGFIETEELINVILEHAGLTSLILADNARADKIQEIANKGVMIYGAKSREGKSTGLNTGYDILKQYNHYYHVDDIPCHVERENHSWQLHKISGEYLDQPEDRYKDTTDTARYGVVYYHLNYNF